MAHAELQQVLSRLYEQSAGHAEYKGYLAQHAQPADLAEKVRAFDWYRRHLPVRGSILDFACRHAPDACLIRAAFGPEIELHGCDLCEPRGALAAFHAFAHLRYVRLEHHWRLPYADAVFDAAVAAGALEHVDDDRATLAELRRCLRPGGVLAITHLPNQYSYQEWLLRRRGQGHDRLYSRGSLRALLTRGGFDVRQIGYQARSDALGNRPASSSLLRSILRAVQAHRLTSCLCAIAVAR